MRHPFFSVGLAALCCAFAAPSFAQAPSDCGVLCRINGYLSSDHMAADPGDGAAPAAAPKPRRPRAAAVRPAIGKPVATPRQAVVRSVAPVAAAPKAVPAKPVAVSTAVAKAGVARVAAAEPPPHVAAPAIRSKAAVSTPRMAEVHRPAAAVPRVEPEAAKAASRRVATAPKPSKVAAAAAPQTRTAAALIPGSAPAMPAGFQPFGTASVR